MNSFLKDTAPFMGNSSGVRGSVCSRGGTAAFVLMRELTGDGHDSGSITGHTNGFCVVSSFINTSFCLACPD